MDRLKISQMNGLRINKMLCCINLRTGTLFLLWFTFLVSIYASVTLFFYAVFSGYILLLVLAIIFVFLTIISYKALINIPAPKKKCNIGSVTAKTLFHFIILYGFLVALVFAVGVIIIAGVSYEWYSRKMRPDEPISVIPAFFSIIFTAAGLHLLAVLYSYYVEVTTPSDDIETVDVFSSLQRQTAGINSSKPMNVETQQPLYSEIISNECYSLNPQSSSSKGFK